MPEIRTLRKPHAPASWPSGHASLRVRERYLRRRSARRRLRERVTLLWVGAGAVLSWLFVVGFSSLAR